MWRRLNLKRNEMLSSLTWKTLARKNIKKQKKLVFRLKALFLLKKIFFFFFSPIANLWPRQKVIFEFFFIFWRYSKTLNLGLKLSQLGILGWNFKKLMSNLKSASSNLLTCKVSSKNKKFLNFGPKIPYLGVLGMQFNKNYYQFFNQHTRICETLKVHPKRKKINLGPKILYLGLWLECWKTIVIFEISTLKFVKNESLTHTVNFGIESAFSEGPRPGPLYKACLIMTR